MSKKKSGGVMARLGNGRLELLVGVLVGGLGGAMVMLMPIDVLQDAVLSSGLPAIIPPFDPPLGLKAQLVLAAGVALLGFLVVFGAMKLIDKAAVLFEESDEWEDDEDVVIEDAPRVRRRDRHPDAPARAPISATRELGTPIAAAEAEEAEEAPRRRGLFARKTGAAASAEADRKPWRRNRDTEEAPAAPANERLRRFRSQAEEEFAAVEDLPVAEDVPPVTQPLAEEMAPIALEDEDIVAAAPLPLQTGAPILPEEPAIRAERSHESLTKTPALGRAAPSPIAYDDDWLDAPLPAAEVAPPAPVVFGPPAEEAPAPAPEPAKPPVFVAAEAAPLPPIPVAAAPEPAFVPTWMVTAEPAAKPAPVQDDEPLSPIADLVARLEQAIALRMPDAAPVIAPAPEPAPVPIAVQHPVVEADAHSELGPAPTPEIEGEDGDEAMDTRLRTALASLRRFAPQG